jgi:thiamine transport system ATP-binding protein
MEILRIHDLTAGYGDGPAVLHAIDLDVRLGEVVALLGASGSGKSTLLRCVAGLHPLREGRIMLGGHDVQGVPVEQRGIGLVFQDHALFPHRDVAGNVAFGPRMQGLDRATISRRVQDALTSVGIVELRDRAVDELSGGEQQRVALARALASQPQLLLLDEPYGSLDRPLRERLITELPGLVAGSQRGAVLVTHDQQEALRVADRVAVLVDGVLHQLDTPERIWSDPADADVAAFLDVGPILDADVSAGVAHGAFGRLTLPHVTAIPDGPVRLLIPRTALEVLSATEPTTSRTAAGATGARFEVEASLVGVRFAGDHHRMEVALGDGTRVMVRSERRPTSVGPGSPVHLAVDTDAVRVYAPSTSARMEAEETEAQ